MKKPTVNRGIAKALAGSLMILAFCSLQGVWADKADSSPTPSAVSAATPSAPDAEGAADKVSEPASAAGQTVAAQEDTENIPKFVGTDTCITCHQDNGDSFQHSAMGRLFTSKSHVPADKTCETCHGPGSLHVEFADNTADARFKTIKFPPDMPAPDANAICLSCHKAQAQFHWEGSPHDMKNVTCVSCHMVHQKDPKNPNKHILKAAKIMDVCFTCHIEKKAQISQNGHMPLNEDEMSCVSCHDMHGTSGNTNLNEDSVRETCLKCHADKRGPFLFEHPPVQESCLNCHNPHGSNNDHMLSQRAPFLCQRCHSDKPAMDCQQLNAGQKEMLGGSCVNCHYNIHGSNFPGKAGQVFQR